MPGLLVLPPGTDLHDHPLVQGGSLVLQDKASCFPALALVGPASGFGGGDVIDACAAPGNKTSHLAALLHDPSHGRKEQAPSRVFAFDQSEERLSVLKSRVLEQMGAKQIVQARLQDFLTVDPDDATYKQVDPLDPLLTHL